VYAWPKGEIVCLNTHANHSLRVPLELIDKDMEAVRIILGMMLPPRGDGRLAHSFVTEFESALA
jgi:hypothetical protein